MAEASDLHVAAWAFQDSDLVLLRFAMGAGPASPVMNILENSLLLLGLPIGMILTGYWLIATLDTNHAGERLGLASLAGLCLLIWNVSVVNYFQPLSGIWGWLCLSPIGLTFFLPGSFARLIRDGRTVIASSRGRMAVLLGVTFLFALTWPILTRPELIFHDGTSNHDGFFWISAAEYLRRHNYIGPVISSAVHPLMNNVPAIIGWTPAWGRMGGEGLLALVSALANSSPLKIYLVATVTLYVPWIAAVLISYRSFVSEKLSTIGMVALVALQPIFIFFYGNANLPNLLGILTGSVLIVATEKILRAESSRFVWLTLMALALHGLICTYPEMLPFILLPVGLLWIRSLLFTFPSAAGRNLLWILGACVAGLAINPASAARAYYGFQVSLFTARANQNWTNLFEPLKASRYLPAMATLSIRAGLALNWWTGPVLTLGILGLAAPAIWRARDRFGVAAIFSGSAALVVYTVDTGFNYGWQKAVQFAGVFWAALLPVAIVDYLASQWGGSRKRKSLVLLGLAGILFYWADATGLQMAENFKWSQQKSLTSDWYSIRNYARVHLREQPVLIDGATFYRGFFYGMWAAYFLPDSQVYFASRGLENAGYLRQSVRYDSDAQMPPPAAFLVSREWADRFDTNSPKLVEGSSAVLLSRANRVTEWQGLYPENGVPTDAGKRIVLKLIPHSRSQLRLVLEPAASEPNTPRHWIVSCQALGSAPVDTQVSGPSPWTFLIPLQAETSNRIELRTVAVMAKEKAQPFVISQIRIENRP